MNLDARETLFLRTLGGALVNKLEAEVDAFIVQAKKDLEDKLKINLANEAISLQKRYMNEAGDTKLDVTVNLKKEDN